MNSSRPEICDGNGAVGIFGIERREFYFGLFFDLFTELSELLGEFGSALRDFLQHRAENEACDGVEIAGESVTSDSEGFQRNTSATSERVGNKRLVFAMGSLDELSGGFYVPTVVCVVPICELADEMKEDFTEGEVIGFWRVESGRSEFGNDVSSAVFELRGAVGIGGVGEEDGEEQCAA